MELEGFEVTFNKNGFKSEADLQMLLEDIKRDISSEKNNIFMQAEGYRQRSKEKKEKIAQKIKKTLSEKVSDNLLFENKAKKDDENIKNTELVGVGMLPYLIIYREVFQTSLNFNNIFNRLQK